MMHQMIILIENRAAWHPNITDEVIREACRVRAHSLKIGKKAAAQIKKTGVVPEELRADALKILREGHPLPGFCLFCGARWEGIEPDARNDECLDCGAPEVFGCDELMKEISP